MLILVFLGLSVLDLGAVYMTDRQQTGRQTASSLNALTWGGMIIFGTWYPQETLRQLFNGHFSGQPGLANTRMLTFWILLEQG